MNNRDFVRIHLENGAGEISLISGKVESITDHSTTVNGQTIDLQKVRRVEFPNSQLSTIEKIGVGVGVAVVVVLGLLILTLNNWPTFSSASQNAQ